MLDARTRRPGLAAIPQHVLILNWRDAWHPEGGGSEIYVLQVAQRLRDDGIRVTQMTARYPGSAAREEIDGIEYVRRGGHISIYLWTALMLLTRRFGRIDSVLEVQNGMPFLATLFTRARVVVLVHHVHREQWSVVGPVLARVGWFMESVAAVRLNRGNRYLAVSQITRRELIDLGVDAHAIDVAYNGLPPVPTYQDPGKTSHPSLVVLSRLVPHKQIDHVISMLPGLLRTYPDLRLTILSSGWWHDHLTELVAGLGLQDRVTFAGHVDDERKYAELARAWVHLMPSLKEGWGLSIVEAARAGTPSIAYHHAGGVTESILEGVTGLLATDRTDFEQQVHRLLDDQELRDQLSEKARVRSEHFTWEAAAERVRGALFDETHALYE